MTFVFVLLKEQGFSRWKVFLDINQFCEMERSYVNLHPGCRVLLCHLCDSCSKTTVV